MLMLLQTAVRQVWQARLRLSFPGNGFHQPHTRDIIQCASQKRGTEGATRSGFAPTILPFAVSLQACLSVATTCACHLSFYTPLLPFPLRLPRVAIVWIVSCCLRSGLLGGPV